MQYVCSTAGCHDMIQKMAFVLQRLQHVAQMLEWKFEVEKRQASRVLMLLDLIDTLMLVLLTQSDKFGSEAS
jgi:hypothetical protein